MQGAEEMQENGPEERQPEGQQSGNRQDPQENDPEECQPEGQQSGSRQDPQGRETVSGKARTEKNGEEARR